MHIGANRHVRHIADEARARLLLSRSRSQATHHGLRPFDVGDGTAQAAWSRKVELRQAAASALNEAPAHGAAAASGKAWWLGFHEPALDMLLQAAMDAPGEAAEVRTARAARLGTLYVTARWLTARLAVARDLHAVLAQQRRWAALEGPTAHAAQALLEIDRAAADIDVKVNPVADRCAQALAELRSLSTVPPATLDALQKDLFGQTTVPRFELPLRMAGARMRLGEMKGAGALVLQAAEGRRLEQAGLSLSNRFDSARRALETGSAGARDVLQLYEQLLFATDLTLQGQSALAIAWVRVLTNSD
jgi:hypothetical protein